MLGLLEVKALQMLVKIKEEFGPKYGKSCEHFDGYVRILPIWNIIEFYW
jgi:hypothetical protein